MFKKVLGFFSKDIGVDLGTSNTKIYLRGRGMVVNNSSIVALDTRTNQIISFGEPVIKMIGKTPPFISIIKPITHGIISDFEVTEKMLRLLFEKIHRDLFVLYPRPRVLAVIPLDVTEVEKKSLEDVILQAGAREVLLVERPMAAAIGNRLPINESIGNFVAELGGGILEIAVISLSGVVTWKSLKFGGETLNKNIIDYLREKFNILIGDQSAEEIKLKIGNALPEKTQEMKVRGRDLLTGLPREISVTDKNIKEAIDPILKALTEAIHDTIEATPPELVTDIYSRGLIISGGTSLLKNLAKFIESKVQIPVHAVDDPLTSAIRGAGYILEDFENLKQVIIPSARG